MKTTNENKKPSKSKQLFSVIILLIASVIWGLAFSAQKDAGGLGGFTVGASRNLFAVLFLIPIIPLMDRITKSGRSLIKNRRPDFTRSEIIGGIISGTFMTFATALQQQLLTDWNSLARPAVLRKARFNQDLRAGFLLVEVGSHGNTLQEALTGARLFAQSASTMLASQCKPE